jgi:hypothetical protein
VKKPTISTEEKLVSRVEIGVLMPRWNARVVKSSPSGARRKQKRKRKRAGEVGGSNIEYDGRKTKDKDIPKMVINFYATS